MLLLEFNLPEPDFLIGSDTLAAVIFFFPAAILWGIARSRVFSAKVSLLLCSLAFGIAGTFVFLVLSRWLQTEWGIQADEFYLAWFHRTFGRKPGSLLGLGNLILLFSLTGFLVMRKRFAESENDFTKTRQNLSLFSIYRD